MSKRLCSIGLLLVIAWLSVGGSFTCFASSGDPPPQPPKPAPVAP